MAASVLGPIETVPGNAACSCEQENVSGGERAQSVRTSETLRDGTGDDGVGGERQMGTVLREAADGKYCHVGAVVGRVGRAGHRQ
jgi:hypothetical protein